MTTEQILAMIDKRTQYAAERVERARAAYNAALESNQPANITYHHAKLERYQQVVVELVLLKDDIDFEIELELEQQSEQATVQQPNTGTSGKATTRC